MAFVTPIPEEQQNQFSQQGQTSSNPLALLPPQAGGSAGQGGAGGMGQSNPPSVGTPTQFGSTASRLSDYLQANKDQVQDMANQVAGQMNTQFGNVQSGVNQAGQNFANLVQSSYTPTDPSVLNQVKSNPVGAANDPNTLAAFRSQFQSQYSGPTSFEGSTEYQGAQKGVQEAQQQADLLKTYPGLSQYLQRNIEKNATPGQNTLDTVLLQSSLPAFQTVQDAAAPFSGLDEYLANITGQQNQSVQAAQAAAPAAREAAQQTLQDITNPFVSGLNTSYTDATQGSIDYNNRLNSIAQKVAGGNYAGLTPEEQSLIGYNPQVTSYISKYPSIYPTQAQNAPINFSQYFTQGAQSQVPTPANVVTPDQIAMWNALTTLGGNSPTGLNFSMPDEAVPLQGQTGSQPGELPAYGNYAALSAINEAYKGVYDPLRAVGQASPEAISYMEGLRSLMGLPQPEPMPTSPQPAPGSPGDMGLGFQWDQSSGTWVPIIPLGPINQPPPPDGTPRPILAPRPITAPRPS